MSIIPQLFRPAGHVFLGQLVSPTWATTTHGGGTEASRYCTSQAGTIQRITEMYNSERNAGKICLGTAVLAVALLLLNRRSGSASIRALSVDLTETRRRERAAGMEAEARRVRAQLLAAQEEIRRLSTTQGK